MTQARNLVRFSVVALALGLATGCTTITKDQLDAVSTTANSALSDARAAKAAADGAAGIANAAKAAAEAAQRTADEALACCKDTTSKLEQMLNDRMKK